MKFSLTIAPCSQIVKRQQRRVRDDSSDPVYIAHDICYYPELDVEGFPRENWEMEWVCCYTAEGYEDDIFSTLPVTGSELPTEMMHSEEEAYENAVLF